MDAAAALASATAFASSSDGCSKAFQMLRRMGFDGKVGASKNARVVRPISPVGNHNSRRGVGDPVIALLSEAKDSSHSFVKASSEEKKEETSVLQASDFEWGDDAPVVVHIKKRRSGEDRNSKKKAYLVDPSEWHEQNMPARRNGPPEHDLSIDKNEFQKELQAEATASALLAAKKAQLEQILQEQLSSDGAVPIEKICAGLESVRSFSREGVDIASSLEKLTHILSDSMKELMKEWRPLDNPVLPIAPLQAWLDATETGSSFFPRRDEGEDPLQKAHEAYSKIVTDFVLPPVIRVIQSAKKEAEEDEGEEGEPNTFENKTAAIVQVVILLSELLPLSACRLLETAITDLICCMLHKWTPNPHHEDQVCGLSWMISAIPLLKAGSLRTIARAISSWLCENWNIEDTAAAASLAAVFRHGLLSEESVEQLVTTILGPRLIEGLAEIKVCEPADASREGVMEKSSLIINSFCAWALVLSSQAIENILIESGLLRRWMRVLQRALATKSADICLVRRWYMEWSKILKPLSQAAASISSILSRGLDLINIALDDEATAPSKKKPPVAVPSSKIPISSSNTTKSIHIVSDRGWKDSRHLDTSLSLAEAVELAAAQAGVDFLPWSSKKPAGSEGRRLFRLGKLCIYIQGEILFAWSSQKWKALTITKALSMAS